MSLYTLENEAFASLVKYGGVVLLKMVVMSPLTGVYRLTLKAVGTEEDVKFVLREVDEEKIARILAKKTPQVDRVRAAHRNDIENIVPFVFSSLLYLSTKPDPQTASMLFKVFATCRLLHTAVYLGKVRQPARTLCYTGGLCINMYMLVKTLMNVW